MCRPSPTVQMCHYRAAEGERLAELADTIDKSDYYLGLAGNWRKLANSHEFTKRIDNLLRHVKS